MPYAHWLTRAAYHQAHALRMFRRGLVYGSEQMALLSVRCIANAIGEASR